MTQEVVHIDNKKYITLDIYMTSDALSKLTDLASTNIKDILIDSLKITPNNRVLVVFDIDYELTQILTEAYKIALNELKMDVNFYHFDDTNPENSSAIISLFDDYRENDLVVLIQSTNFRLNDFRIRLNLFAKKLKVIEHLHLGRNLPKTFETYIKSLKYDQIEQDWYQKMANKLTTELGQATKLEFKAFDASLEVGVVEIPKLNIGDYADMENIGGTFPIGEVFTEAQDFKSMNGSIYIYGFADREFNICFYEPFRVDIEKGLVIGYGDNAPHEFIEVLDLVKSLERPLIREIGFGLNRAITKENPLGDITAYERILGIHFSLGEKHSVYKKPGITVNKTKFHIDLFLCIDQVKLTTSTESIEIMNNKGYSYNF
jgi:aminopeptidase